MTHYKQTTTKTNTKEDSNSENEGQKSCKTYGKQIA